MRARLPLAISLAAAVLLIEAFHVAGFFPFSHSNFSNTASLQSDSAFAREVEKETDAEPSAGAGEIAVSPGSRDGSKRGRDIPSAATEWKASGRTTFGAQYPSESAKILRINPGLHAAQSPTVLDTPGTGASIRGYGQASRLNGDISLNLSQDRADIQGFALTGPGAFGLRYTERRRRTSDVSNLWIRDKDVGVSREAGAFDRLTGVTLEKNLVGLRVTGAGDSDQNGLQILNSRYAGVEIKGGGETRMFGLRVRGGSPNIWLHGSTESSVVENYWVGVSAGGASREMRTFPVLAVDNDNGHARLQLSSRLQVRVENRGGVLTGGAPAAAALPARPARNILLVSDSGSGSVTGLTVGELKLIDAPVSSGGGREVLASAIAAAVNARTASTGFTSKAFGPRVYIFAPAAEAAAANGRVLSLTTSGDVKVEPTNFLAFVFSDPHGVNAGSQVATSDDLMFEGGRCAGMHAVKHVESPTVVLVEMPNICPRTGYAWKPLRVVKGLIGGRLKSGDGGRDKAIRVLAVTDTQITVDTRFDELASLPRSAEVSFPGWDLLSEADDTGATRVNDQFFIGGNINYTLIKSGFNISFFGTRLKSQIWVDDRANPVYRSNRIVRMTSDRGRSSDTFDDVTITGANTGFAEFSFNSSTGAFTPGNGYAAIVVPNKDAPLKAGEPETNEVAVSESGVSVKVGDQAVVFDKSMIAILNALKSNPASQAPARR